MSNKTLRGLIGVFVVAVLVVGVLICGFVSRDEYGVWFKNNNLSTWHWEDPKEEKPVDNNNGINLLMSSISVDDYAAFGISERAISAKTIRADFDPQNTTDKRVTWSLEWASNEGDFFYEGLTLEDCVRIIPAENNQPSCSLEYLCEFGVPIILRCESIANPELYATTSINCVAKIFDILSVTLTGLDQTLFTEVDKNCFDYEGSEGIAYSIYASEANLKIVIDYTFTFENEVLEYLREYYDREIYADDNYVVSGENCYEGYITMIQPENKTTEDVDFWQTIVHYCVNENKTCVGKFVFGSVQYYDGNDLVWSSTLTFTANLNLSNQFMQKYSVKANDMNLSDTNIYF